jgi:hypothetical protein
LAVAGKCPAGTPDLPENVYQRSYSSSRNATPRRAELSTDHICHPGNCQATEVLTGSVVATATTGMAAASFYLLAIDRLESRRWPPADLCCPRGKFPKQIDNWSFPFLKHPLAGAPKGAGDGLVQRLYLCNLVTLAAHGVGQVAQLVEQWTENPRVGGSSPPLTTFLFPDAFFRSTSDRSALQAVLSQIQRFSQTGRLRIEVN